jgi:hypothetical protein
MEFLNDCPELHTFDGLQLFAGHRMGLIRGEAFASTLKHRKEPPKDHITG